jgi:hypothetical protein
MVEMKSYRVPCNKLGGRLFVGSKATQKFNRITCRFSFLFLFYKEADNVVSVCGGQGGGASHYSFQIQIMSRYSPRFVEC